MLAHGYTGDVTDWHHQIAAFSSTYRVLVVEHRGHGRSEAPSDRSLYRIPLMAEDLLALADAAGLGRFHLAGHSMGGGIVQEAALATQERLLSLTLEGTSCKFNLNADPQMAAWRDRRLHLARTEGMAAVAREPLIAPLPPHMPPERAREEADRLGRMSPDAFVGAAEGLLGWEGDRRAGGSNHGPDSDRLWRSGLRDDHQRIAQAREAAPQRHRRGDPGGGTFPAVGSGRRSLTACWRSFWPRRPEDSRRFSRGLSWPPTRTRGSHGGLRSPQPGYLCLMYAGYVLREAQLRDCSAGDLRLFLTVRIFHSGLPVVPARTTRADAPSPAKAVGGSQLPNNFPTVSSTAWPSADVRSHLRSSRRPTNDGQPFCIL